MVSTNTHFGPAGQAGRGAKIQPFNLDEGQCGKTRSHYLLVKGSEIDVRMEIISVLLYNNTIQATRTTDLTTANEVSTEKVSADDDSRDSQEVKVSSPNNPKKTILKVWKLRKFETLPTE